MTLLSRLYTYRPTETRSPTEDFLSEVLCEWLHLASQAGLMRRVMREMLAIPDAQCPTPEYDFAAIRWSSQHRIGIGYRGTGKRPDLVGQGPDFFLLIENKIGAGFTTHEDEFGATHQLDLYHDYQLKQKKLYGTTVLITHYTLPPDNWVGTTATWSRIHCWLVELFNTLNMTKNHQEILLRYWTKHLIAFLEENQMSGTKITLSDIIAIPAYDRLQEGLSRLGLIAQKELINLCEGYAWGDFRLPHGGASGEFKQPRFFGWLLTPKGDKADDSYIVLWMGVLARSAYEIKPHIDGIPELSVGVVLWTSHHPNSEECSPLLHDMEAELAKQTPNMVWDVRWEPYDNSDKSFTLIAQARLSLLELLQQNSEGFWDETAQSFFATAGKALLELPTALWVKLNTLKSN